VKYRDLNPKRKTPSITIYRGCILRLLGLGSGNEGFVWEGQDEAM
jgi:hypothetical protein